MGRGLVLQSSHTVNQYIIPNWGIMALRDKEWMYLTKSFVLILIGMLIPIAAGILYMYYIGGVQGINDFVFANWIFNIEYSMGRNMTFDVERLRFLYKVFLPAIFIVPFVLQRRNYVIPVILGYVVTLLTIGKAQHYHYLMVFIPLMVASITCLHSKKMICGVLFVILVFFSAKTFVKEFRKEDFFINKRADYQRLEKLLCNISDIESKNIWSYNGAFLVDDYIKIGLVQCNRMFLPWQMDTSNTLLNLEKNKIIGVKPDYVIYPIYSDSWMTGSAKYKYSDVDEHYIKTNYKKVSTVRLSDGIVVSLLERMK